MQINNDIVCIYAQLLFEQTCHCGIYCIQNQGKGAVFG